MPKLKSFHQRELLIRSVQLEHFLRHYIELLREGTNHDDKL